MATVASHKWLFTHYQKDGVDNHSYHREFLAHVETIETYGGLGAIGVIPTFLKAKVNKLATEGSIADATYPTDNKKAVAITAVQEEYLAALMLSGANHDRFNELRNDLKNQYDYGKDCCPKTTNACLSLLNHWTPTLTPSPQRTPRNPSTPTKPDDNEDSFFCKMQQNQTRRNRMRQNVQPSSLLFLMTTQTTAPSSPLPRSQLMFGARTVGYLAMSLLCTRRLHLPLRSTP
jgi:hypothetical protein